MKQHSINDMKAWRYRKPEISAVQSVCDTLLTSIECLQGILFRGSPVFGHKLSGCGEEIVAEQVVQLGWEEHWILHTQLGPVQLNNMACEWLFQA